MGLRGWGNGFTAAGLILAVGVAVAQAPEGNTRYLIALGITVVSAILAIILLRPKAGEETARRLNYLRQQTSARDIAVLRAASEANFPETHSKNALPFAPVGELWQQETKEKADTRAKKLIILGLMEKRGSTETQTSKLGHALVAFDDALHMLHQIN